MCLSIARNHSYDQPLTANVLCKFVSMHCRKQNACFEIQKCTTNGMLRSTIVFHTDYKFKPKLTLSPFKIKKEKRLAAFSLMSPHALFMISNSGIYLTLYIGTALMLIFTFHTSAVLVFYKPKYYYYLDTSPCRAWSCVLVPLAYSNYLWCILYESWIVVLLLR